MTNLENKPCKYFIACLRHDFKEKFLQNNRNKLFDLFIVIKIIKLNRYWLNFRKKQIKLSLNITTYVNLGFIFS